MMMCRVGFRVSIAVALLVVACGCRTNRSEDDKSKQLSTMRIHLETVPDMLDFSVSVEVFRQQPMVLHVDRRPFLTETDLQSASVTEDLGQYSLKLEFNRRGTWLLEQYTTANIGRRFGIYSQFGSGRDQSRWLGAPKVTQRNSHGILIFTPDASREECDRIVLGLTNAIAKIRQKDKW